MVYSVNGALLKRVVEGLHRVYLFLFLCCCCCSIGIDVCLIQKEKRLREWHGQGIADGRGVAFGYWLSCLHFCFVPWLLLSRGSNGYSRIRNKKEGIRDIIFDLVFSFFSFVRSKYLVVFFFFRA